MMTLITEKSSAQTLMQRAAAAATEHARTERENLRAAIERNRRTAGARLVERVASVLGEVISEDQITFGDNENASVAIDGHRFSIVDHGNTDYPRDDLSVAMTCARGCGNPLWVSIEHGDPLVRLHDVLLDTKEEHSYQCVEQLFPTRVIPDGGPPAAAREACKAIVTAGERMAKAHAVVQDLADGRAIEKSFAIRRLMGTINEETGKPHSATSAEKVVEHDEEYRAYRRAERDAEVERLRSLAAFEAAKVTGVLEVEIYKAWERNA